MHIHAYVENFYNIDFVVLVIESASASCRAIANSISLEKFEIECEYFLHTLVNTYTFIKYNREH